LFVLSVCLSAALYAQTTTGSVSGTVTDPNGASVPGARVVATDSASGRSFTATTTDAGIYVLPILPVGKYNLSAEHSGFKKSVQTDVEVRVALRETIDIHMEIGDVQQSISVAAEVPLLETTAPERGQNLSPQFLSNLPLFNGSLRSAETFVFYMPGVNNSSETSINGSGGRAREVEIDGASLTIPESGGTVFNFPGFEAYQEFKLITSTYNAEYGRLGGGLETFVSKSGTNQVHGSAFLNLKRDILDAAGWSVNQNRANPPGFRPKERFNEEGGSAGGPVWIPKVYDGRNKSFFFFTYAKIIQPASILLNSGLTVPTSLMTQGDFTQVAPIYDPATTTTSGGVSSRMPFAGNLIPKTRWSKVAGNIVPLIPAPNTSAVTGNFNYTGSSITNDYIWSLKIDHSITPRHRLAFFLTHENQAVTTDQYFPGPLSNGLIQYQQPDNYRWNYDLLIKPTMLMHTTFGFTRQQQQWDNPLQKGFASKIGLPQTGKADATPVIGFETDMPSVGLPAVGLLASAVLPGNNTTWGMDQGKVANGGQWNWTTHFNSAVTWTRGKHEFKFGGDIRRLRTTGNDWAGTNGFYYFSRVQTANPTALTTTGHSFASFLLGAVDVGAATATPVNIGQIRYGYHGAFFQDTWRLTPRLTLDLGARYEVPIGWHDVNGNYSSLDTNKPNPGANGLPGALIFAGVGTGRTGQKRLYPTDFSNLGPRTGFAYRLGDRTVLRGGFGIYYQTLGNGGCGCTDGFGGSYSQISDGLNPAFNWDNGGVQPPAGFKNPPFLDPSFDNFNAVTRMGPNYGHAPRIYNWSFTIQHEVRKFLFETAYVGNRSHGLNATVELNQLPTSYLQLGSLLGKNILDPAVVAAGYKEPFPGFAKGWGGGATLAQSLRPFPQFGTISDYNAGIGRLWYDSLQSKVERRFGGWQFLASFVWSKNLDLMHYRQIFSQGTQVQAQDSYNINAAKSYSPFDQPRVLNVINSYQLPFGRGKKFLGSSSRVMNAFVGGWIISDIHQYRSSGLIEVQTPGNPLGPGQLFSRITNANVINGRAIRTGVSRTDLDPNNPNPSSWWFNTGANAPFALASPYTLGNAALYYGAFRNPPVFIDNISVVKNFAISESIRFQYRADAFNAFNRTNFGGINGTIGNANFGRPSGPQLGPRAITMGLRLEF
jgi:hypothetical protein